MKQVQPDPSWPEIWKTSYEYDVIELCHRAGSGALGYLYSYLTRRAETLDLVRTVAPRGATILDVAAAQGNFTLTLAELGYEVTWNDVRGQLAGYVKLKHESGVVRYLPGDIFELGVAGPYDLVLATEIIEHVAHPDEFFTKLAQLVKPGGHIVMTTPNGSYFGNRLPRFLDYDEPERFEAVQFRPNADGHIFLLHVDEVEVLARRAGLTLVDLRLFSNVVTHGWLGTRFVLPWIPTAFVKVLERVTQRAPLDVQKRVMTHMGILLRRPLDAVTAGRA